MALEISTASLKKDLCYSDYAAIIWPRHEHLNTRLRASCHDVTSTIMLVGIRLSHKDTSKAVDFEAELKYWRVWVSQDVLGVVAKPPPFSTRTSQGSASAKYMSIFRDLR